MLTLVPLPPTGPPARPTVDGLDAAVALLRSVLAQGGDGDPVAAARLLQLAQAADGLALRQLASIEQHRTAGQLGHHSTTALVVAATGLDQHTARSTVVLADRLSTDLRPAGLLLETGQLNRRHTQAIRHGLRGLPPDTIAAVLPAVCAAALSCDPVRLDRELRERAHALSPALADAAARRLHARVGVSLDELPDGTGHLRGTLSPECLGTLRPLLDLILTAAERDPTHQHSLTRRRHDALHTLARHAADCPDQPLPARGSGRARLIITATLGTILTALTTTSHTDTTTSHTDTETGPFGTFGIPGARGAPGAPPASIAGSSHGLLTHDQLLRLACDADISTIHLNPSSHQLNLSRSSRTATDPQWLALIIRDRHCIAKSCYRPPAQCQAHHVVHWLHGGPSNLQNYALLCHHHHHALHDNHAHLPSHDGRTLTPTGWTHPCHHHPGNPSTTPPTTPAPAPAAPPARAAPAAAATAAAAAATSAAAGGRRQAAGGSSNIGKAAGGRRQAAGGRRQQHHDCSAAP